MNKIGLLLWACRDARTCTCLDTKRTKPFFPSLKIMTQLRLVGTLRSSQGCPSTHPVPGVPKGHSLPWKLFNILFLMKWSQVMIPARVLVTTSGMTFCSLKKKKKVICSEVTFWVDSPSLMRLCVCVFAGDTRASYLRASCISATNALGRPVTASSRMLNFPR